MIKFRMRTTLDRILGGIMKKIRLCFLTLFVLLTFSYAMLFVSCDDKDDTDTGTTSTDTETDTQTETDTGIDPIAEGTVTFKNADGTVITAITGNVGDKMEYVPSKDGYLSCEYYGDSSFNDKISIGDKIPEGETVVYVKWTSPITYTVSFDAGRGVGAMESIQISYDEKVALPANTFTLKNEEFSEWRLYREDGSYESFIDKARVKNLSSVQGDVLKLVAVYENADLPNFVIENGVVTSYNGSLETVVFPEFATSISKDVFKGNASAAKIKKIVVPDCYNNIECGAFAPCTSLKELTVPFIGGSRTENNFIAYLFGAETYLDNDYSFEAEINVLYGLVEKNGDFSSLLVPKTLKKVTVTDEIKTIAEGAFYKVYSLEKLVIPNSEKLYSIGAKAFDGCWQLGYDSTYEVQNPLYWLENVKTIGDRAFAGYITEENDDGSSYVFTRLFEIPKLEKIQTIGKEAFYGCVYLMKAEFGPELKTIGNYAFTSCASLTELNFPDSLTKIGEYAFTSCASISKITIGKGIREIAAFAFADCTSLASVTISSSSPAKISEMAPFSNGIESKYNSQNWFEGYKPIFTHLTIYVSGDAVETYKGSWSIYSDYISANDTVSESVYYYGKLDDGTYTARLRVVGNIIYVTDPYGEFLNMIDPFGYSEFGTEYTLFYRNADVEGAGREFFIVLSNPDIVDYLGDEYETTVRVRPEIYKRENDTNFIINTVEFLSVYGTLGKGENSLYKIVDDGFGHATLYARENISSEFTEVAMPAGAVYSEIYLYVSLVYDEQYLAIVYEDEYAVPIEHRYFFTVGDRLIEASNIKTNTAMTFLSYGDFQITLDGGSMAKLSLFNNSYGTDEYIGSYNVVEGEYGSYVYKISLTDMQSGENSVAGTLVFDGYFDGGYHRCKISLSNSSTTVYRNTVYRSADLTERTCINADDKSRYNFYDYSDKDGNVLFRYAEYITPDNVSYHGEYSLDGDTIKINVENYSEKTGAITDNRMSFSIKGVLSDEIYQTYDYGENYVFYMSEDFYGTLIDYYMIKMDGYGNAKLHDTHNDDTDIWYTGTYYNTYRSIGSDDYGEFWIYCFNGQECDKAGNIKENGKTATYYYVTSTEVYDDGAGDYYGDIKSISLSDGEATYTVYEENGLEFATMVVDPFGITTLTLLDCRFENGKAVYTVNTEMSSKITCIAYLTTNGEVTYIVVYDNAGNYLFVLTKDENGEWLYQREHTLNPQDKESDILLPDFEKAEKLK